MLKNLAKVYSAELDGINANVIEVEVDLNVGLHSFNIVGLADKALNEARERVNSALKNCGTKPPNRENRKITVNLAPADVRKAGSHYDLAIALGYLLATQQIKPFEPDGKIFVGELALDGRLRPVAGILNIAQMAEERGFSFIFVPEENGGEAAVLKRIRVVPIRDLTEAIDVLEERNAPRAIAAVTPAARDEEGSVPDFSEIKGQEHAKRALMIAAAGAHNLLMIGPPGVGKSLLSQALVGILPDLDLAESIEITKIYSAAGLHPKGLVRRRPFRSPHQTASLVSIVGGGTNPKPGEISLSHRGVLFLDELPEFPRNVLEALRQPMESGSVHVARAKGTLAFPAKFGLIAAMNPCPCGFYGDAERECRCTPYEVLKYEKRISGPLLDRIDLQIKVPRVALATLRETSAQKESPLIKAQVEAARAAQRTRLKGLRIATNAEMGTKQVERFLSLAPDAERFLIALDRAKLSPRGYYRLLKVARTIADIDAQRDVTAAHLAEAFSYRLREET